MTSSSVRAERGEMYLTNSCVAKEQRKRLNNGKERGNKAGLGWAKCLHWSKQRCSNTSKVFPSHKEISLIFVGLLALSAAQGRLQNIRQKKIKNGQAWDEVERRDVTQWVQCPKQHQPCTKLLFSRS